MTTGIIGLGSMGLAIAENLIDKGYTVYGYDINPSRCELLVQHGGNAVASCAEVGSFADTVILMVFDADNLRDVLFGEGSLLDTLKAGGTLVVTASLGKDIILEVIPELEKRGIHLLDTPLMASEDSARAGQMHILVSGGKEVYQSHKKLFADMGEELYFVGDDAGMGQMAKSCMQALFSLTFESAFEIDTLAAKTGLNMDELHRLFKNGPASSELFAITEDNIRERRFTDTKNPLSILDKDVRLALKLASDYGISLPAVAGTATTFSKAMEKYAGDDIFAAVQVIEAGELR